MKKTVKKALSVFMCAVLVATMFSFNTSIVFAATTAGTCGAETGGKNAEWSYNEATKTLTIRGTGATANYLAAAKQTPWEKNGFKKDIITLVVEEGITQLGNYSFFNCESLKNVSLPSTLTTICGMGTTDASYGCFQQCTALEEIILPNNLTTIQTCAFKGCTSLKKIVLPDSVTSIGNGAFCNCDNLESVTFGSGLKETGLNAFRDSGVKYINWGEGITTVSTDSFCNTALKNIKLPETISSIGLRAFANCYYLVDIVVNNPKCSFGTGDPISNGSKDITIYGYRLSTAETFANSKGYTFVPLGECTHESVSWKVVTPATCTEKGYRDLVCDTCSEVVNGEEIKALGHEMELVETVDNTDIDGHIYESYQCTRCEETRETVTHQRATAEDSATNYIWIDGYYDYVNKATCTSGGNEIYTCKVEGCSRIELHYLTKAGHTVEEWTILKEADCMNEGKRKGVCTVCSEEVEETVPVLEHDYSTLVETVDNTAEDGHIHQIYECGLCKKHVTQLEHKEWVEGYYTSTVISPAHCVVSGLARNVCDMCNETATVTIPSNGQHEWEEVSRREPDCTGKGAVNYKCANCTMTKSENIDALGHDYVKSESGSKEPTCTTAGNNYYTCSRSGCSASKSETLPALGHTIDESSYEIIYEEDCENNGLAVYNCSVCNAEGLEYVIEALGHDYEDIETDLTTENKPGHVLITPTCTRCESTAQGRMEHKEWTDGYFETENGLSPTCSVDGYTKDTCTICAQIRRNPVPKLGHLYAYNSQTEDGKLSYSCTICHLPTKMTAVDVFAMWNIKYVNKPQQRTAINDSSYLDVNKDGVVNTKDFALLNRMAKMEIAAAKNNPDPEPQPETPEEPQDNKDNESE